MKTISEERRRELEIKIVALHPDKPGGPENRMNSYDLRDILAILNGDAVLEGEPLHDGGTGPTITFRPYEPKRPTLDQMPEGEAHRCALDGIQTVLMREGSDAHAVFADGTMALRRVGASRTTVLDADPPTPRTLADVPEGVWCVDNLGRFTWRSGGECFVSSDNLCRAGLDGRGPFPHMYPITRVLGYPEINL